jgi:hypothetical protein
MYMAQIAFRKLAPMSEDLIDPALCDALMASMDDDGSLASRPGVQSTLNFNMQPAPSVSPGAVEVLSESDAVLEDAADGAAEGAARDAADDAALVGAEDAPGAGEEEEEADAAAEAAAEAPRSKKDRTRAAIARARRRMKDNKAKSPKQTTKASTLKKRAKADPKKRAGTLKKRAKA